MSLLHSIPPLPRSPLRIEIAALAALAIPTAISGLSGLVASCLDTIQVGALGPSAIGAVAVAGSVYVTSLLAFTGFLGAITPLVSQAFGAEDREAQVAYVWQGLWLALVGSLVPTLVFADFEWGLVALGQTPEVARLGAAYLAARSPSLVVSSITWVLRGYLYGVSDARAVTAVVILGSVVNAVFNALLIQGWLGFPQLGVAGSGLATSLSELAMLGATIGLLRKDRHVEVLARVRAPEPRILVEVLAMGIPLGATIVAESSAFSAVSVFVGWLGDRPLAAHQVGMSLACFCFVLTNSVAVAASIRVGQATGRGDPDAARGTAGAAGVLLVGLSGALAVVLLAFPERLARIFTTDREVIAISVGLLAITAVFQFFDGLQAVAGGCLRGLGDTRAALIANLAAYWALGIPLGYLLAFPLGTGLAGLWVGLTVALAAVGIGLTAAFARRQPSVQEREDEAASAEKQALAA